MAGWRWSGGGFPGPQRPSGADTHGWEFTGTHSSCRQQGWVSQAAFSLTLFLRDPLGPCPSPLPMGLQRRWCLEEVSLPAEGPEEQPQCPAPPPKAPPEGEVQS